VRTFDRILGLLKVRLLSVGFNECMAGIFRCEVVSPWHGIVAITGNDFAIQAIVGVSNSDIDNVVFRALQATYPNVRRQKCGQLLLRAPLHWLVKSAGSPQSAWSVSGKMLTLDVVDSLLTDIEHVARPFFQSYASYDRVVEWAIHHNLGDQSQQFSLPALYLKLGKRDELDAYVASVERTHASAPPEARSVGDSYKRYVGELRALFGAS
jgi:hypothetical protein